MTAAAYGRQLSAGLTVAAARLRGQPGRALVVAGGIGAAAAMLVAVLGGSVAARDRAVQKGISQLPLSQRAFRVDVFNLPPGQDYPAADATARRSLARLTSSQPLRGTFLRELRIGGGLVQLASIDGLDRIARLRAGRLPRHCVPASCEVVQLGRGTRTRWNEAGIHLVRVGVVDLPDRAVFGDSLQSTPATNGQRPTLLVAAGAAAFDRLPAFGGIYRAYSWVAPVDPHRIQSWDISGLLGRESGEQNRLSSISDLYELTGPDPTLLDAQSRGRVSSQRMVLIGGEVSALLLGFALVVAMGLRRGAGNERRRLLQRGARKLQVELVLGAEVGAMTLLGGVLGVAAGIAAVAVIAGAAGIPAGGVLDHSLLTATGIGAIAAAWVVASVAVFAIVRLPEETVAARRIRLLDVAAAGAVLAIALEVARGGLDTETLGSGGDPTLLVLLPGLTAFAAAVVAGRLLTPLMRGFERAARRAPLSLRLASLALARAPRRTVAVSAFLVVSFGLALFASTYRSTLAQGARDEAAFQVPLDFTLAQGSQLVLPLDAAPLARYERLARGVHAYPVVRQLASVPGQGTSALSPTVLGLPAAAIGRLHWRSDYSHLTPAEIADRLSPGARVSFRGVALPAGARLLTAAVDVAGVGLDLELAAEDGSGRTVLLPFGEVGPGRHVLRLRLPPNALRQIDGLEVSLSAPEQYGLSHREAEVGAASAPAGSVVLGPLRAGGRVLTTWRSWLARGGAHLGQVAGGVRVSYAFTTGQAVFVRRRQPTDGHSLPILVSSSIARALGRDRTVALVFGDIQLPARIVGTAARFPDSEQSGEGFAIADEKALSTALDAELPGRGDPLELWLAVPPHAQGRVAAALARPPFSALQLASRRAIEQRVAGDPLTRAIELALSAAAIVALALAALGFLVTLLSDLRDERGEFFDLEAQGVTPVVLRRQFQLRSLALIALGACGGILLGLVLFRLVVALIQVSAGVGTPEPPLRLAPAWGLSAAVGALVLACLAGVVELTTLRAFRDDVPRRATWSLE